MGILLVDPRHVHPQLVPEVAFLISWEGVVGIIIVGQNAMDFWYSLQCIKESLRAETGPSAISAMDVLTSREPFALVGPSIWVVAMCEGSPFATDDVAHTPWRLKWIDGFDELQPIAEDEGQFRAMKSPRPIHLAKP